MERKEEVVVNDKELAKIKRNTRIGIAIFAVFIALGFATTVVGIILHAAFKMYILGVVLALSGCFIVIVFLLALAFFYAYRTRVNEKYFGDAAYKHAEIVKRRRKIEKAQRKEQLVANKTVASMEIVSARGDSIEPWTTDKNAERLKDEQDIVISDEELAKLKKKRRRTITVLLVCAVLGLATMAGGGVLIWAFAQYVVGPILFVIGAVVFLLGVIFISGIVMGRVRYGKHIYYYESDELLRYMEIVKRRKKLRKQRAKEAKLAAKQQARQDKILTDLDDSFSKHNKH